MSLRLVALPVDPKKPPSPGVMGEVVSISGVATLFRFFKLEDEFICLRPGRFAILLANRAGDPERGVTGSCGSPDSGCGIRLKPTFSVPGNGDAGKGLTVPVVLSGTGGGGSCAIDEDAGDEAVGCSVSSSSCMISSSVALGNSGGGSDGLDGGIDEGPLAIDGSGISCATIANAGPAVSIINGPAARPDSLRILTPHPVTFKLDGL